MHRPWFRLSRSFSFRRPTPLQLPTVSCLLPMVIVIGAFGLSLESRGGGLGVTPADQIRVPEGFEVDLVYEVPSQEQGSWVSLTVDPKGRLIACDQYGSLYRVDLSSGAAAVEKLDIEFAGAQGLLCAFGSLYANVNSRDFPSGVWRLTDTDGDDQYDKKEHLIPLVGGREHGPHAMVLSPDGKRIVMCAGNNTDLPKDIATSRVPMHWDEDHLLGRMPDARGHNANEMAPGGFVASFDPDGGNFELIATGFRNHYDIAFNDRGDLFTYDADMEWDVGTPWYRPTRVNHVISGAEFGWRNGTGKWPAYYPDSFGAVVDIGPGSPTGIVFGRGAKFPETYRNALFIADWSYGNIHAVTMQPDGSTYQGSYETFASGVPLPVTDMVVHESDGALYFTIGGRRAQSALYRVRYAGAEPTSSSANAAADEGKALRDLRRQIEQLHVPASSESLALAIDHLDHEDRGIRFASRIALELHPVDTWKDQVLGMSSPMGLIHGAIALSRVGATDARSSVMNKLSKIQFSELSDQAKIDLMRAYGLVFLRLATKDVPGAIDEERDQIVQQMGDAYPTGRQEVDRELAQLLVYVNAPNIVERVVEQLEKSPSQQSQIHYAMVLRDQKDGWTDATRRAYFDWFNQMSSARGGMSFGGFLDNIKNQALSHLTPKVTESLQDVLNAPGINDAAQEEVKRDFVQQWKVDDLAAHASDPGRPFDFERGKAMFAAAQCYKCHRMGLQGGILGPDLTGAGGRFSVKDLLSSMVEPAKVISDQYGATQFLTEDGQVIVGRIINLSGDRLSVMTNMLDPSKLAQLQRDEIEEMQPARTSMMPSGLLDTLSRDEVADLVAYLRAGGNPDHALFANGTQTP